LSLTDNEKLILNDLLAHKKASSVGAITSRVGLSYNYVSDAIAVLVEKMGYVKETKTGYYRITNEGLKFFGLPPNVQTSFYSKLFREYRPIEFKGMGTSGIVWKAKDVNLDRIVAIKFLHGGKNKFKQLEKEGKALARVPKPDCVVTIHHLGYDEGNAWIVMEYVDAPTLQKRIVEMVYNQEWFSYEDALLIIERCLECINFAHSRGVIHGDIKPANIFTVGKNQIKLTDFGVARIYAENHRYEDKHPPLNKKDLNVISSALPSPTFASPEVLEGEKPDFQSDLFSIGMLAYLLLTGRHPFWHMSGLISIPELIKNRTYKPLKPSQLKETIPKECEKVVMGLLEKDKRKRYKDASTVLSEWREAIRTNAKSEIC
jgi:serine/threonine-protein kinase